jgi:DNA polymerase-1
VAAPGRRLVGGDFGQLELRVLAWITSDKQLTQFFEGGIDIHSAVAAALHNIPLDAFDPEGIPEHKQFRRSAKAVSFGIAYAAQAKGIQAIARDQHGVVMTLAEAENYRQRWLDQYPQVAQWQGAQMERTQRSRIVRTLGGRRYLFDWEIGRRYSATLAVNLPVQGSAADIAMETMVLLHERLATLKGNPQLVLQVHDEFLIEVDDDPDAVAAATACLEQAMIEGFLALLPDAPITGLCDIKSGASWAEVH